MISDRARAALIAKALAAAEDSRAIIESQQVARRTLFYCTACRAMHPRMFTFRGRDRAWHAVAEAQMTPRARAARAAALRDAA